MCSSYFFSYLCWNMNKYWIYWWRQSHGISIHFVYCVLGHTLLYVDTMSLSTHWIQLNAICFTLLEFGETQKLVMTLSNNLCMNIYSIEMMNQTKYPKTKKPKKYGVCNADWKWLNHLPRRQHQQPLKNGISSVLRVYLNCVVNWWNEIRRRWWRKRYKKSKINFGQFWIWSVYDMNVLRFTDKIKVPCEREREYGF